MSKRKSKPTSDRVSFIVRIDPAELAVLGEQAEALGVSRNWVVAEWVSLLAQAIVMQRKHGTTEPVVDRMDTLFDLVVLASSHAQTKALLEEADKQKRKS